jgi:hypothetical protein
MTPKQGTAFGTSRWINIIGLKYDWSLFSYPVVPRMWSSRPRTYSLDSMGLCKGCRQVFVLSG